MFYNGFRTEAQNLIKKGEIKMNDLNNGNDLNVDNNGEQSSLDANNYDGTNSDESRNEISEQSSPNTTNKGFDDIPETLDDVFNMPSSSAIIKPIDDTKIETKSEKKPANKLIRNKSIKTRVNELEKKKISDDAKAMHLNVSDYIRSVALRKRLSTPKLSIEDTEALDKALREVKIELNRMGNNINQIAKFANVNKDLNDASYMQFFGMVGSFRRIEDMLAEIKKELQ